MVRFRATHSRVLATVTLYRNARPGQVVVTANGFSTDGTLLTGELR